MIAVGGLKLVLDGANAAGEGNAAGGPGAAAGAAGRGQQVTVAVVGMHTFTDRIEVLGAAKARQSITLTAPASQLITRLRFESGDYVRQGQVLAELNAREQDAAIVQAQSQVTLAKSNWDRWQQLADRGIAPAATAEQMKALWEQAVASLDANRARAGDRTIRAPFSGVVGLTDAAQGMLVNPGSAIATLDDVSVIRVDFPVPEASVSVLRQGLPITATAAAYPNMAFRGQVAKIDTRLDPATRSVTARAEFPNPDGRLKPGMLLHVVIDRAVRPNPAAPEAALIFESGESYVYKVEPAPQGAGQAQAGARSGPPPAGARGPAAAPGGQGPHLIAVRHAVQTGLRQDGLVEITSGLKPGERIVADGTNRVRPNDPIRIAGGGAGPGAAPAESRPQAGQPAAPARFQGRNEREAPGAPA